MPLYIAALSTLIIDECTCAVPVKGEYTVTMLYPPSHPTGDLRSKTPKSPRNFGMGTKQFPFLIKRGRVPLNFVNSGGEPPNFSSRGANVLHHGFRGFFEDFQGFRPKVSPMFLRSRLLRSRYFCVSSRTGYAQKPARL